MTSTQNGPLRAWTTRHKAVIRSVTNGERELVLPMQGKPMQDAKAWVAKAKQEGDRQPINLLPPECVSGNFFNTY